MKVLSVDPGPHVGIATWTDKEIVDLLANGSPGEGSRYAEKFSQFEMTPSEFYSRAADFVRWADRVVCENFFILGARAKDANETIEMIGVLRYLCSPAGAAGLEGRLFVTQAPAERKFASVAKLKRLGCYVPASADHAKSATQHLVTYLASAKLLSPERLLDSPAGGRT